MPTILTPSSTPTLQSVRTDLGDFFRAHSDVTAENHAGMKEILNRETLIYALASVINDPDTLRKISYRSHRHPLGFDKFLLIGSRENTDGYELRLHVWWPGTGDTEENRHLHQWNYASRVIAGLLENHQYAVRELRPEERIALGKFTQATSLLPPETLTAVQEKFAALDAAEANISNALLPVTKAKALRLIPPDRLKQINRELCAELNLSEDEVNTVRNIHHQFLTRSLSTNQASVTGQAEIALERVGTFVLEKQKPQLIEAGELYFGDINLAHHLITDGRLFTSTFMVTGPMHKEQPTCLFYRQDPSGQSIESGRLYVMYRPQEAADILLDYTNALRLELYSERFWEAYLEKQDRDFAKTVAEHRAPQTKLAAKVAAYAAGEEPLPGPDDWSSVQKLWLDYVQACFEKEHQGLITRPFLSAEKNRPHRSSHLAGLMHPDSGKGR